MPIGGWLLGVALCGCGNMSGLGGSEQYGCKAPAGVQCQSVSGTYFNGIRGTGRLPPAGASGKSERPAALTATAFDTRKALVTNGGGTLASGYEPLPLRSPSRILRLWIKPWEDADHDLVDQSYVYVRVGQGKWMLDHVQRQVREAYAPLRPPSKDQVATAPAPAAATLAPMGASSGSGLPLQGLDATANGGAMDGR